MELSLESAFSIGGLVGNLSYILLIVSMAMRDIFWLRLIAIFSGLTGIAYDALWLNNPVGIFWESCFTLVNLVQWAWLVREKCGARLNEEEERLKQYLFPELSSASFRNFLNIGTNQEVPEQTPLTEQGQLVPRLILISYGSVNILVDGKLIATCRAGDLIGEISFLTDKPATATAISHTNVRYLSFNRHSLSNLLDKSDELRAAFTAMCNNNLADKLIRNNQAAVAELKL